MVFTAHGPVIVDGVRRLGIEVDMVRSRTAPDLPPCVMVLLHQICRSTPELLFALCAMVLPPESAKLLPPTNIPTVRTYFSRLSSACRSVRTSFR
ncbi:hypothetical protein GUJ93_ZPchr0011g28258 [Zizania palustris]|uniref:Uncharacterized protein n=1 Tax=Zizania palustris TaxID=103762 RepID=A0A8J5WIF4_ZIZPA|nr:hypothetical protein GUJ93_ZPchr0011g28258 [Zizania palustris]